LPICLQRAGGLLREDEQMKLFPASVLAVAALLSGCAAQQVATASTEAAVVVARDEFRKMTTYRGPDVTVDVLDTVLIRAWRTDGQPVEYQIYVSDHYDADWRFYSSAFDLDGQEFNVTQIARRVGACSRYSGCSKTETVGLNVTRAFLEKYRSRDLTFKIIGKAGEQVFTLPSRHIAKFLETVQDAAPR
jgi:hypothetical protein